MKTHKTREEIEVHLGRGGLVIEEGCFPGGSEKPFRIEWRNPVRQVFLNTPWKMARYLWERQQRLHTTLTLCEEKRPSNSEGGS